MKKSLCLILALTGLFARFHLSVRAADADEEQKLISVLQSAASPAQKDAACARLKMIGTSRCVPAVAALLTDEQLSHSALYALEPMQSPEAGAALLNGLQKTSGLVQVGIINSLAARHEARAIQPLFQLLRAPSVETAGASARALGQIGGSAAVKALRTCSQSSTGPLHAAAVDGLLRCANGMLNAGDHAGALAVFEQLDIPREADLVRVGAFNGRVRASGNAGLKLALRAISGPASPNQVAALQLVRDLQAPSATAEFAKLLPHLEPALQVALVGGLSQRGDTSALGALTSLAGNCQPEVRLAIVRAMDDLGDASSVGLLANVAASSSGEEQKAARQALADLHRGDVTQSLIGQMASASPAVQAELARALGARGDKAAVPKLLELAKNGSDSARKGALQGLSTLIDNSHLADLAQLVVQAKSPAARSESAEALNAAYQHLQAQRGQPDTAPLVQGLAKGSKEARTALLPICGGLVDPAVRAALREALQDQDPQVRATAVRAMCDTIDAELLPDVQELARSTQEDSVRSLAINGAVRLLTQEEAAKLPSGQRVASLKQLLGIASHPDQKRKVIAGLAEIPDLEALRVIDTAIEDNDLRNEAARASIKVASALPGNQAEVCRTTLKKALAGATDPGTRQAVQAALTQLEESAEYLTAWEVAGPYQQPEKDYAALFDIAFAPELKGSNAKWAALAPGADPKRPWVMDLLKALGGQQCVAYARTWVHSDQSREALLELGSDDGVKIWLNDKQVYAANVARPLQPGSDKVKVTLQPGWNPLLLKVTQNNQGWEFCVRVCNSDGTHLDGIRCDSTPQTSNR